MDAATTSSMDGTSDEESSGCSAGIEDAYQMKRSTSAQLPTADAGVIEQFHRACIAACDANRTGDLLHNMADESLRLSAIEHFLDYVPVDSTGCLDDRERHTGTPTPPGKRSSLQSRGAATALLHVLRSPTPDVGVVRLLLHARASTDRVADGPPFDTPLGLAMQLGEEFEDVRLMVLHVNQAFARGEFGAWLCRGLD
eukprot:g6610.t1